MLKAKLTKVEHDALPDPLKEHYTADKDGAVFVLQAEGFPDPTAFAEFRDNNRRFKTELEQVRAKLQEYDGVDPAEHKRLKDRIAQLEKAPIKDDKELEERIERVTAPLKTSVSRLEKERDDLKRQNEEQTFTTVITNQAQKLGIQPDFIGDVLHRARERGFRLIDGGEVRAFKGDDPLRGDDGKEVTLERFIRDQPAAFFGVTKGSNNTPGARSGGTGPSSAKVLIDPTPLELGRNAAAIAKGEIEVRRTS